VVAGNVNAGTGTIVEIQSGNELTTAITNGHKVRMDMSDTEYAIVDYKNHGVQLINPQKQTVTLLNMDDLPAGSANIKINASLSHLGPGKPVAGFKTQKFSYSANGKNCGVIYGSENAYHQPGVKQLVAAMQTMMEKQRAALGRFASLVDACTLADMQLINHVDTIGVPMLTVWAGSVELEVKNISVDVAIANDVFEIPAMYKAVDRLGNVVSDATPVETRRQMEQPVRQTTDRRQVQQTRAVRPAYQPEPVPYRSGQYRYRRGPGAGGYYPRPRY
jgi:hypothetical protein